VLPAVGSVGIGDNKAYYYLRDSVNNFMNKKQLKDRFENNGFKNSQYKSLTFGISSIHCGTK
jgi:Methylase involved in ubiquinone/menaquinone biosynthesis